VCLALSVPHAGGFYSPGIDPATPGLVAYWKFDEGAGYVVHDVSGHSNDLSITQPPKWEVSSRVLNSMFATTIYICKNTGILNSVFAQIQPLHQLLFKSVCLQQLVLFLGS